jgi:dipeptidase E
MGDHPEHLVALAGEGARAAVIANAMDDAAEHIRQQAVGRELQALAELGCRPCELDLRGYSGDPAGLCAELAGHDLLWVRGGNTFMLRHAWHRVGDDVLPGLLGRDTLAYGGYSAGACVLAPSLRGLETVDDAGAVSRTYGAAPVWEGLGVLQHAIVPHCESPDHPESAACDAVAEYYQAAGIPHVTLRDGQALVISGGHVAIC